MTAVPRDGPTSPDEGGAGGLSAVRYDSFVVRVLSRPHQRQLVSGQVTHVATRRTVRFTDLQRVVSFVLDQLGRDSIGSDASALAPILLDDDPALDGLSSERQ